MKRIYSLISLLLVAMLTMIFAACKPSKNEPEGDGGAGNETTDTTGKEQEGNKEENGEEKEDEIVLDPIKIYMVGDSTMSSFDDDYFYPRYGYGTQLGNYLNSAATVVNYALSGRSSKSFLEEDNYVKLKNQLKEGDYLIIGFGHNDEKSDDAARFTDASKPYTEEGSFGYSLNENYIKLAQEKGAIPILCTPIVRAKSSDDYSGNEGHNTATGNYAQAIIDLGKAVNVSVIDLTAITKARYKEIGYSEAIKYHAVVSGKYDTNGTTVIPNMVSADTTHLNIYGAKYVAYSLATELAKLDGIGKYVLSSATAPTEADLAPKEGYVIPDYASPNLSAYTAPDHFKTISVGWYGTAFGDVGGNPQSDKNGYIAKEETAGVFTVGNDLGKGKFSSTTDGFAFLFRQVEADKNFTVSVTATIKKAPTGKQAGFGLMLRDDCTVIQDAKGTINTNYVTAGVLTTDTSATAFFSRENTSLDKGQSFLSALPAVGDTYEMKIERIGQTVNVSIVYNGQTYSSSTVDFDFFAVDNDYMYVGMFANRGTVVEFTNLEFEITGLSQGA